MIVIIGGSYGGSGRFFGDGSTELKVKVDGQPSEGIGPGEWEESVRKQ